MSLERYNRQVLFSAIGEAGQQRICRATAVVAGCGALGTASANALARAGVGHLRIVDRDFVEESNLQRQVLFDEHDCRENLPKAIAAERNLRAINSAIAITGIVTDINPANAEELVKGADVVVDGTDNFETRFLLNDACVKHGIPWVYGGAVGSTGLMMTIIPGQTPCLRCLFETAPPPGMTPTCETAGILGALPGVVGNWQAAEALKICAGRRDAISAKLLSVDLWSGEVQQLNLARARENAACPCCKRRNFEFLEGQSASTTTALCGRNAVQINPRTGATLDLQQLAGRVRATAGISGVTVNRFLLKFSAPGGDSGLEVTVFPDGRAIIKGTSKVADARTAYAKYVGA
ncbi:MAG: ThiF family adenylyltransferase [Planctomycetota bacterium]|nr:ThiF family adenylyltransferase [Planctomycetota bacterium]